MLTFLLPYLGISGQWIQKSPVKKSCCPVAPTLRVKKIVICAHSMLSIMIRANKLYSVYNRVRIMFSTNKSVEV